MKGCWSSRSPSSPGLVCRRVWGRRRPCRHSRSWSCWWWRPRRRRRSSAPVCTTPLGPDILTSPWWWCHWVTGLWGCSRGMILCVLSSHSHWIEVTALTSGPIGGRNDVTRANQRLESSLLSTWVPLRKQNSATLTESSLSDNLWLSQCHWALDIVSVSRSRVYPVSVIM